jgi:hypothetical protein
MSENPKEEAVFKRKGYKIRELLVTCVVCAAD